MKYVTVKFVSDRDARDNEYSYKCRDSVSVEKYDSVLVETQYGFALAIIQSVSDTPKCNATKYVVEKVTIKALESVTRKLKLAELEKRMAEETKNLDKLAKYKVYANLSPEMSAMVKEYESLIL
jgi:uncharacterized membrane protein